MFRRGVSYGFSATQRATARTANRMTPTRTLSRGFSLAVAPHASQTVLATQLQGVTFSRRVVSRQAVAGLLCLGGVAGMTMMSQTGASAASATPNQRLQQSLALRGSLLPQTPRQRLQASLALRASLAPPSPRTRLASAVALRRSVAGQSQLRMAAGRFFSL